MKKKLAIFIAAIIMIIIALFIVKISKSKKQVYIQKNMIDYIMDEKEFRVDGISWGTSVEEAEKLIGKLDSTKPRNSSEFGEHLFPIKQFEFCDINFKTDTCCYYFTTERGFYKLEMFRDTATSSEATKVLEVIYQYLMENLPTSYNKNITSLSDSLDSDYFFVQWNDLSGHYLKLRKYAPTEEGASCTINIEIGCYQIKDE